MSSAILGAGLTCAVIAPASAHPHIFIDAKATIVFNNAGELTEIKNAWTFDEAFSVWQVQGLDTDGDGTTSSAEMQELADENLQGLAEYQFYTSAGEAKDSLSFASMQNAKFTFEDNRSTLTFGIKAQAPYRIKDALEIAIADPEYYVAITFANVSDITLENAPKGCDVRLVPGHDMPDDVAARLYALPADVTELPPDLAAALRGVQGAIEVKCVGGARAVAPEADTAVDAVNQVAEVRPILPFGGPPPEPGFKMPRTGFLGWVAKMQSDFYQALTAALGRLKQDSTAFWVLGGLSFLYGVFHAAGPGHGKVVISSYVLANEAQVRRGIALSFAAALMQSLVAVVFVGVAAAMLGMTSVGMGDAANWIGIASYAMVALLGLWLIARKLFGWGRHHSHAAPSRDMHATARGLLHADEVVQPSHALSLGKQPALATGFGSTRTTLDAQGRPPSDPHYGHDHGDSDHEHHGHHHVVTADQVRGDWREQLGVVLAVGLRPCSGALVVLVFALSQGVLLAGIAAVFLMGLGTAITVSALATLAVTAKGLARRLLGTESPVAAGLVWWAELLGAVLVFAFGIILLLASV